MSNIAFLFLPLAFSSLPAVLPFVSPSSQVDGFANIRQASKGRDRFEALSERLQTILTVVWQTWSPIQRDVTVGVWNRSGNPLV